MIRPFKKQNNTLPFSGELGSSETKRALNKRLFGRIARRYNVLTAGLSLFQDRAWKRQLLFALGPRGEDSVLDVATGTGDIARMIRNNYGVQSVTGLDLSEQMLRIAQTKKVPSVCADMGKLPFEDGHFSIVCGGYALRNAPDLDKMIGQIARVCAPGARVGFLEFTRFESPMVAKIYEYVLLVWGAFWGVILHGNWRIYTYIPASLRQFKTCDELFAIFSAHGFCRFRTLPLFFGAMSLHVAEKPIEQKLKSC